MNLGAGLGYPALNEASEDAFFVESFMYKLNVVEAQFNKKNLTEPWEINCVG